MSTPQYKQTPLGGIGAAEYVASVFGGPGQQHAGADGSIAVAQPGAVLPTGGVGLTEMAVPVVLMLTSNYAGKMLSKKNMLNLNGGNNGGALTEMAVPATLIIASNYFGKSQLNKITPGFLKSSNTKGHQRRLGNTRRKFKRNRGRK